MTDHKISDFVFKKSNHVVTPASTYPIKATSDTVSVNPLLLLQQYIFVGYGSRELVDVLKYELWMPYYPYTMGLYIIILHIVIRYGVQHLRQT